eukprot:7525128-Pyramimonas_sp.AAC.1
MPLRCAHRQPTLDSWTLPGLSSPAADCRTGPRPPPPSAEAAASAGSGVVCATSPGRPPLDGSDGWLR